MAKENIERNGLCSCLEDELTGNRPRTPRSARFILEHRIFPECQRFFLDRPNLPFQG